MTLLCTGNFAYASVCAKLFCVHENQCTQILNLSSPDINSLEDIDLSRLKKSKRKKQEVSRSEENKGECRV